MTLLDMLDNLLDIISPILYGVAIAYLLSPILNFIEKKILRFPAKKTWLRNFKRVISIIFTLLFVALLLTAAVSIFIPQIIDSYNRLATLFSGEDLFDTLSVKLDGYIDKLISGNDLLERGYAEFRHFLGLDAEQSLLSKLSDYLWNFLEDFFSKETLQKLLDSAWGAGSAVISFLIDAVVTIILCLYLLFTKEKQVARVKKMVNAFFSPKAADKIYHIAYLTDDKVGKYLTVQVFDSILVGIVSYFIYMIADLPFYPVLALISGVTNIIPYFGPFIGAIPNGIFILISEPSKLLPFIIIVLIIQQIDGNILIPLIQSDNMKMDVFWVLVGMTIMGGIFGLPGMIVGVPIFSVIYILIKEYAEERLAKRGLPLDTEFYTQSRRPPSTGHHLPAPIARLVSPFLKLYEKSKEKKRRRDLPDSGRLLNPEEEFLTPSKEKNQSVAPKKQSRPKSADRQGGSPNNKKQNEQPKIAPPPRTAGSKEKSSPPQTETAKKAAAQETTEQPKQPNGEKKRHNNHHRNHRRRKNNNGQPPKTES